MLLMKDGRRYGVEMKFRDPPGLTRSVRVALKDLGPDHLRVVYPGERVTVVAADALASGAAYGATMPPRKAGRKRIK